MLNLFPVADIKAIFLSLAIAVSASSASATDFFENRPGQLANEELLAATAAMRSFTGVESGPPLVSSGRREGHRLPSYAVFADAARPDASGAMVQPRIYCNTHLGNPTRWTCGRHTVYDLEAQGQHHRFIYLATTGAEDLKLAGEFVAYLRSTCLASQLRALAGAAHANEVPARLSPITQVTQAGQQLIAESASAAGTDLFTLEPAQSMPGGCKLKLVNGRIGSSGASYPESFAREQVTRRSEEREAKVRAPTASFEFYDTLIDILTILNVVCSLLSIVGPFVAASGRRRASALVSLVLTLVTVGLAIASLVAMNMANIPGIGHFLLLVIPATLLAMISFAVWATLFTVQKFRQ